MEMCPSRSASMMISKPAYGLSCYDSNTMLFIGDFRKIENDEDAVEAVGKITIGLD